MNNDTTEAEALAESAMTVSDWRRMEAEGLTAREYFRKHRGVDPADHNDENEFRAAALSADEMSESDTDSDHGDVADDGSGESSTGPGTLGVSIGTDPRRFGDSKAEIAALSRSVMSVSDLQSAEQADMSSREYVADRYGVDPREHRTEAGLRQAIEEENK